MTNVPSPAQAQPSQPQSSPAQPSPAQPRPAAGQTIYKSLVRGEHWNFSAMLAQLTRGQAEAGVGLNTTFLQQDKNI